MPIIADIPIYVGEDGTVTVSMTPPVGIGGWTIRAQITKIFGSSSGIITAYVGSGMNNQSGINVVESGAGIFRFKIPGMQTSGLNPGNYACEVRRLDSGRNTLLQAGFLELKG